MIVKDNDELKNILKDLYLSDSTFKLIESNERNNTKLINNKNELKDSRYRSYNRGYEDKIPFFILIEILILYVARFSFIGIRKLNAYLVAPYKW